MNVCFVSVSDWLDQSIGILSSDTTNLDYINQIPDDWSTPPFIDMIVKDADTCPGTHPEVVFSRPFYGSQKGCSCIGVWPD